MTSHNLKLRSKISGSVPMRGKLMEDCFCIFPGAVPMVLVAVIKTHLAPRFVIAAYCESGFYGARTMRFGRLLVRSGYVANLVMHYAILALTERALAAIAAIDALRPDQAVILAEHFAAHRRAGSVRGNGS